GYYETPRQIDLSELADRLDVPRSTLSYRLRRAEATLASTFVGEMETIELAAGL
ncbi:helix-turn-helix domain-containing protein, partial [Natrialba aegyptia]